METLRFSEESIKKLLPSEILQPSTYKALKTLIQSVLFFALGVIMLNYFPWYLLPISWAFMALVASGLFAVAYSCSENKFFDKSWLNKLTGAICMLPMLYNIEQWKKSTKSSKLNSIVDSDFWFFSSPVEWFKANIYFESNKVLIINAIVLYLFSAISFTLIIYFKGVWGLFKFYLIPLAIYHLFMSSLLKINNEAYKMDQNSFVDLPKLIESIINNCNNTYSLRIKWDDNSEATSLREKLSSMVPHYNLSQAQEFFKQKMDEFKTSSVSVNFEMLKKMIFDNDIKISWVVAIFITVTPIISIYGIFTTTFNWKTYLLGFIFYYLGGLGITMGYHRLWSHRSYDAHWTVQFVLLLLGSSTFEGPVIEWCNDHRIHHRYTDTDKDPYNIKRSFWYAHMGWMFFYRPHNRAYVEHDLCKNPLLMFQYKYYPIIASITGIFLPMTIAGYFWDDWRGGLLIAGFAKTVLIMQCTFCINSVAHYFGEHTFADERTPRDSMFVSLFTFGEGYHNFHHEFPYDYRNGLHFYDYDPGKWCIKFLSWFGLAYNLKKFNQSLFEKGKIQMQQKKIEEKKKLYDWGPDRTKIPKITKKDFEEKNKSEELILVDGYIYNVKNFEHPGGQSFMKIYKGKDASKEFNETIYNHSSAARNLLDTMVVYQLVDE